MTVPMKPMNLALRRRNQIPSADINDFASAVSANVAAVAAALDAEESSRLSLAKSMEDELSALRSIVERLSAADGAKERRAAAAGEEVRVVLSMADVANLLYPEASPANLRASVSPFYGQVTVPVNGVQQKFTTLDFRTLEVVPPADLYAAVAGSFDKGDGEGVVDREHGGTVSEGTPANAFNGMNTSVWVREVRFDLDSDVDSVECELTAHVPERSNQVANCLCLNVHPWRGVDVTEVAISASLSGPFVTIPGFVEKRNAGHVRLFFVPQNVARIRVRLRQRNWRQKDGLKVFRYGLEELSLQLVDWDKTWDSGAAVTANHTCAFFVDAHEGMKFGNLVDLFGTPDFEKEDSGSRHVHVKVCADADGETVYWDSDLQPSPRTLPVALGAATTRIYVLVTLNFVETSGGTESPFPVGTTPWLNEIGLAFTEAGL